MFLTRYSSLEVTYCFLSLHSLIEQTSIGHPVCARHFREARSIKLPLTSKKADVHEVNSEVNSPHSDLVTLVHARHEEEKAMATHSITLAWTIPGMAESGRLPSMRSHRVRYD